MRQKLKNAYFHAASSARLQSLLGRRHLRRGMVHILNFHRISPDPNPYWPPLTPEAFQRFVAHAVSIWNVVRLDDLVNTDLREKPQVVFSFDDGFRDFIEYAVPILEPHGIRVNQNVVGESVATGRPPWVVAVADALGAAPVERVRALRVPGFGLRLNGDAPDEKTRYGVALTGYLKGLSPQNRESVWDDIARLLEETEPTRLSAMMNADDVVSIARRHEVGAHSYHHESSALLNDEEFVADTDRCANLFAQLGLQMRIYAFPNGSFRPSQPKLLRARGVEHVLAVGDRPARLGAPIYTRISMYGDSPEELQLRAMGHNLAWARGLGRQIVRRREAQ